MQGKFEKAFFFAHSQIPLNQFAFVKELSSMTKHDRWYSSKTQIYWTCKALLSGRTINHIDEIGEARGWRLGAIIHNLRQNHNWPIEVEYRGSQNIAHYWLRKDCDRKRLRFPSSAKELLNG